MSTKLTPDKAREKVMVVSREDMFKNGIWHGLKTEGVEKYTRLIFNNHKFMKRGDVEDDPKWQQIIPYIVFEDKGKIFLMHRKSTHTDKRLASNYSIGIGGHINEGDIRGANIISWAQREFAEEVIYNGKFKAKFLGVLNDDSNEVGLVHVGLVIKVEGDGSPISVRDEHKSGTMVDRDELLKKYKQMETWSQIIVDGMYGRSEKSSSFAKASEDKEKSENRKTRGISGSEDQRIRKSEKSLDEITGILPDWLIVHYIDSGKIAIDPKDSNWKANIDQVSIDFHLGSNMKLFRVGTYRFVDTRRGLPEDAMEEVNLNEGDPFILEPGAFAIASTKEVLKLPADVLGRLEGKSSLARLGILVHSTAARFDPGWNGAPVLELGNLGPKPAILYCGMPICAFTFEKIGAPVKMPYEGSRSDRYSGSRGAVASRIHQVISKVRKNAKR